ncbi:hypothetical protein SAMN05444695_1311, partial [Rhodococcus triatomae]
MSSSPIPSVTVDTTLTIGASSHPSGLLDILTAVPDPRKRRGVRHTISTVLAIALA